MDRRAEHFHVPGDDEFWSESHYLDAVGDDVAVHARLGFYPNRDVANVFAYLVAEDAVYALRDESIDPAAVHGTTVDTPDLGFELVPEEPGRAWRVAFEGTARRCRTPHEVVSGGGDPVPISCEFVARGRHDPFHYSDGAVWPGGPEADRYEVATRVEGEATVGDADATDARTYAFAGPGERDHSWGPRDWTGAEWLWISGGFGDAAYNLLSAWAPGEGPPDGEALVTNGFWFDGEAVHALTDAAVSAEPPFSADTATAWVDDERAPGIDLDLAWDGGSADVAVEPGAVTPVDWERPDRGRRALLARAPASQTRDGGVDGRGFLENMTQLSLE